MTFCHQLIDKTANLINLLAVNDLQSWVKGRNNVYIGRKTKDLPGSKWGNPYIIGKPHNRPTAVALYEQYVKRNQKLANSIKELKGKTLGCWCAPKLCHGGVLHIMAGNKAIYQSSQMEVLSHDDCPSTLLDQQANHSSPTQLPLPQANDPHPTLNQQVNDTSPTRIIATTTTQLDQQVSEALQAMNDILNSISRDLSDVKTPIPTNAATPLLSSTADTNKVYETLLESSSSLGSTFDRDFPSVVSPQQLSTDELLAKRERSEIEYKLKNWRSSFSKSFQFKPSSSLPSTIPGDRKYHSAPTTPLKRTQTTSPSSHSEKTLFEPPASFSYNSTSSPILSHSQEPTDESQNKDFARKILEFLANKIDLLSVSINALQFNLSKISESLSQLFKKRFQELSRNWK